MGTVSFGYDGAGRRVRKTSGSTTTRYIYDGDNLLAEVDGAAPTTPLAEYTYYPGIDQPHSLRRRMRSDSVFYYAQDFPGNVLGLVNGAQSLVAQYKYKPYGGDDGSSPGNVPNSFRFAARQLDPETGLYYMRARYYDPALGRFVSEDPLGLAAGINQYIYGGNNPVNYRDPSGEFCKRGYTMLAPQDSPVGTEEPIEEGDEPTAGSGGPGDCGGGGPHCTAQISGYRDEQGNWYLDPEGEFPGYNVDFIVCDASGTTSTGGTGPASLGKQGRSCPTSMIWPVPEPHTVTSGWGFRQSPFGLAGVREGHWAIDIAAGIGVHVRASTSGSVIRAGPSQGYGNVVVIQDATGFQTQYGHVTPTVRTGASVQQGDVIGDIALIGRSTGPHLDFALRYPNGVSKDPRKCLP